MNEFDHFRDLAESRAIRRLGGVTGTMMKRVPRGFPADHEAARFLKLRQYLIGETLMPSVATSARFYGMLIRRFATLAPFIDFLNTPLVAAVRFSL